MSIDFSKSKSPSIVKLSTTIKPIMIADDHSKTSSPSSSDSPTFQHVKTNKGTSSPHSKRRYVQPYVEDDPSEAAAPGSDRSIKTAWVDLATSEKTPRPSAARNMTPETIAHVADHVKYRGEIGMRGESGHRSYKDCSSGSRRKPEAEKLESAADVMVKVHQARPLDTREEEWSRKREDRHMPRRVGFQKVRFENGTKYGNEPKLHGMYCQKEKCPAFCDHEHQVGGAALHGKDETLASLSRHRAHTKYRQPAEIRMHGERPGDQRDAHRKRSLSNENVHRDGQAARYKQPGSIGDSPFSLPAVESTNASHAWREGATRYGRSYHPEHEGRMDSLRTNTSHDFSTPGRANEYRLASDERSVPRHMDSYQHHDSRPLDCVVHSAQRRGIKVSALPYMHKTTCPCRDCLDWAFEVLVREQYTKSRIIDAHQNTRSSHDVERDLLKWRKLQKCDCKACMWTTYKASSSENTPRYIPRTAEDPNPTRGHNVARPANRCAQITPSSYGRYRQEEEASKYQIVQRSNL